MKWYKVEGLNYNGRPFIKKIPVGGKKICLVGYDNELFALAAKCPHAGEDITRGWCSDGKLVCPFHRFSYNLSTGRGSPGQGDYIETYAVKVNDGGIYIGFETWKEKFKRCLNKLYLLRSCLKTINYNSSLRTPIGGSNLVDLHIGDRHAIARDDVAFYF